LSSTKVSAPISDYYYYCFVSIFIEYKANKVSNTSKFVTLGSTPLSVVGSTRYDGFGNNLQLNDSKPLQVSGSIY
jgi:hypothetical protein